MKIRKRRIYFRVFSGNRLTIPLLLNIWETNGLDRHFDIHLADAAPGRLSIRPGEDIREGDVFIYSFMTPHLPWVTEEIGYLRSRAALAPILAAGGPHVSAEPDLSVDCGFNVIFRGPGEDNFLRFGRDLLSGNLTARAAMIYDDQTLDNKSDSERKVESWEKYFPISAYLKTVPPLEIARGCFWRCRYCQTGGENPCYRSLDSISVYLEELRRRRLPRVGFISPSAFEFGAEKPGHPNVGRIRAVLERCRQAGFNFIEYGIFPSEVRPDTVRDDVLATLANFVANRRLTFGAQSASDVRLAAIGRGHRVLDIITAVEVANSAGFAANLDFIIALPGETAADRRELLELMKSLKKKYRVYFQLHHFSPLAGSPFARRLPSYLSDAERQIFSDLKKDGLASNWWLAGEKSVKEYFNWLKKKIPVIFKEYH
ncbi:MAG: TIGR04013 family B12-binding domain/radical SAM domain-containing protein [Candidatus Aminicenantes bacterium]|nr:TIGR04013 family B12-binding domain/radical SAM domain-containing protein [Candidatus Aminicenantes bacterium]